MRRIIRRIISWLRWNIVGPVLDEWLYTDEVKIRIESIVRRELEKEIRDKALAKQPRKTVSTKKNRRFVV